MGEHEKPHDASSSNAPANEASVLEMVREVAMRWGGPIICAATGAIMVGLSWRKWAEPIIDFGHELYIPWQLSEGKLLYRDIAHLYGPLSQYFNAACFRLFGVSLTTLIVVNLCLLAGLATMIHRLLAHAADRLAATAAVLVLLLVFAFSQYSSVGNYNFVCPYSHEATHGTVIAVGMIACLSRAARARNVRWSFLAGVLLGGTVLTRAEVSLAAVCAAIVWVTTQSWRGWSPGARFGATISALVAGLAAPLIAAFTFFGMQMGLEDALRATFGAWTLLLSGAVTSSEFHRTGMGLDDVPGNGLLVLRIFGWIVAATAVWAGLDRLTRALTHRARWTLAVISSLALFVVLHRNARVVSWELIPRALPVAMIAAWVGVAVAFMRHRTDTKSAARVSSLLAWCTYSGVLLAKMALKAQVFHYGFYLAMPAVLTLVVMLLWGIPRILDATAPRAPAFRCMALATIAAGVIIHVRTTTAIYSSKNLPLSRGGDTMYVFPATMFAEGAMFADALSWIQRNTPPSATLVALPEGAMLNYLSRRTNPTPFINVMMVEVLAYGEEAILASLSSHRPDYVVLIHKDTSEFGVGLFGVDPRYGARIRDWIRMEYVDAQLFGPEPLQQKERFGIKILRRR